MLPSVNLFFIEWKDYHKRSNLAEDTYPRGIFDERTFYSTKSGGALRKAENNSAFQVWLN
jgi:hypothetical protein